MSSLAQEIGTIPNFYLANFTIIAVVQEFVGNVILLCCL